uniref:Uncharacterized protein n=1 Tax=Pinguiococcus pyrenoidosus TaxID=172671 RepID=A0A7R9U9E7_9STRA|mmetsp:Transcript_19997/g.75526  ORF Transcript_19997/g.75526 Transcript_19997/m.75526 type:complete len:843 (+) Transcript_19997:237-2765(+)
MAESPWRDVTQLVGDGCGALPTNRILCLPDFELNEAMCALELCAPKLDTVMSEPKQFLMPSKHLERLRELGGELLPESLVHRSVLRLVTAQLAYLSGALIQESVGSFVFCHAVGLQALTEAMKDFREEDGGSVSLHTQCLATLVSLVLGISRVAHRVVEKADVFEEDDFLVSVTGVDLLEDENGAGESAPQQELGDQAEAQTDVGRALLKNPAYLADCTLRRVEAEGASDSIETYALATRALVGFFRGLQILGADQLPGQDLQFEPTKAREQFAAASDDFKSLLGHLKTHCDREAASDDVAVDFINDDDLAFDIFFHRGIFGNGGHRRVPFGRCLIGDVFDRWTQLCQLMTESCDIMLLRGFYVIRLCVRDFGRRSVNVLPRSVIVVNLIKGDESLVFGGLPLSLIVREYMRSLGVPGSFLTCEAGIELLQQCLRLVVDSITAPLYSRTVVRARLQRIYEEWTTVQGLAATADAVILESMNIQKEQRFFFNWASTETLRSQVQYLETGLEMGLYQPQELDMVYWYLDFTMRALLHKLATSRVVQTQLREIQAQREAEEAAAQASKKAKKKGKKKKEKARAPKVPPVLQEYHPMELMYTARHQVCVCLSHFLRGLRGKGLLKDASLPGFNEGARFRQRFGLFNVGSQPQALSHVRYVAACRGILPSAEQALERLRMDAEQQGDADLEKSIALLLEEPSPEVDTTETLHNIRQELKQGAKLWTALDHMLEILAPRKGPDGKPLVDGVNDLRNAFHSGFIDASELEYNSSLLYQRHCREIKELKRVCLMNSILLSRLENNGYEMPANQRLVVATGYDETASGAHIHYITTSLAAVGSSTDAEKAS